MRAWLQRVLVDDVAEHRGAKLVLYGGVSNGFSTSDGDIDCTLLVKEACDKREEVQNKLKFLVELLRRGVVDLVVHDQDLGVQRGGLRIRHGCGLYRGWPRAPATAAARRKARFLARGPARRR